MSRHGRDGRDDSDEPERITYEPTLVASICAQEGGGKTEFGAGCPDPMQYHSVDVNTEEVLEKWQDRKRIFLTNYDLPSAAFGEKADIQHDAELVLTEFLDKLKPIIRKELKRMPKTVVLDTATEFFELALLADHGRAVQILPEMRTKTNYKWKSVINGLKRSGCHVILLHRLRDKYETKTTRTREGPKEERVKVEGEYEREGFSKTGFLVNVEAFLFHDTSRAKGEQYGLRIVRCTQRPVLIDKEYWGDQEVEGETVRSCSFEFLATKVYRQTKLKDWR
jgi:hypothetical protein